MNPYTVECGDCDTVESGLGFDAALAAGMEHTLGNSDHTCQITTTGEPVIETGLAEGTR